LVKGRKPLLPPLLQRPCHLSIRIFTLYALALIVEFFTLGKSYLYLGLAASEVHLYRYEGVALFLYLTDELAQLPFVDEQLTGAQRVRLARHIYLLVGADMRAYEEELALQDARVALLYIGSAISERLDLRALQHNARLELLFYEVVVEGLSILTNHLLRQG